MFTRTIPEQQNITLKPVMVAFHAGGYILGSGTQDMQPAEYLLTEDVVLVSINYRLGVFGKKGHHYCYRCCKTIKNRVFEFGQCGFGSSW